MSHQFALESVRIIGRRLFLRILIRWNVRHIARFDLFFFLWLHALREPTRGHE